MKAQKIDRSNLNTFGIVIASFLLQDKLKKVSFFQKIYLVTNIKVEVVLRMFFLIFSYADIQFIEQVLVQKTFSIAKALPITQRVKVIDKKEFTAAVLKMKNKTLVIHMIAFNVVDSNIHPFQQAQHFFLDVKKIIIRFKYADYINVFSPNSVAKFPKYISINNCSINLIDNNQPRYS